MATSFKHENFEEFLTWIIELSVLNNIKTQVQKYENDHLDKAYFGPTGLVQKVDGKPGELIAEMHPSSYESEKVIFSFDTDVYDNLKTHLRTTFKKFLEDNSERSLLVLLAQYENHLNLAIKRITKNNYYSFFPNYRNAGYSGPY